MSRWVLAALAMMSGLALVVSGAQAAPDSAATLTLEVGLAGLGLVAASLWRWPAAVAPGLVLVSVPWAAALVERPAAMDCVAVGALLLLTGELAGWSQDRATVVPQATADAGRVLWRTAAILGAGAAASSVLLVVSALPPPGSLLRLVVGLSAALAVVAFVSLRRWEGG